MSTTTEAGKSFFRPTQHSRARKVTTLALAGLVLASGFSVADVITSTSSAQAATPYVGLYNGRGEGVGSLMHSDGTQVYCLEIVRYNEVGRVDAPLVSTGTLPAASGGVFINGSVYPSVTVPESNSETVRQINYVLSKWGRTQDGQQAAAVQLAVWQLRGGSGDFDRLYATYAGMGDAIAGGTSALANQLAAEARVTQSVQTVPVSPIVQQSTPYRGTLNVSAGTTVVTIVNGVFLGQPGVDVSADGRTATVADGAAHNIQWQGQPSEADEFGRYYTVEFNGSYEVMVAGSTILRADQGSSPEDQDLGTGDGEMVAGTFDAIYWDPDTIWSPVLSTETPSKLVQEGEAFSDTVTFDVAEGSNPWRTAVRANGETMYAPITAEGTLYGPFLSDPALNPSGTPPVGAPVAATATVTTDTAQGPGMYTVDTGDQVSTEPGYYTWVWDIDFADQAASVVSPPPSSSGQVHPSLPENYFFTDGFGQASEGQLTPSNLEINTELSDHSVVIGGSVTDDVTLNLLRGGWLQDENGGRTAFNLRGTVYLTDEAPVQQETAPADAVILGTTSVSANTPGVAVTSESIRVPLSTDAQYLTVQWCLLDEDQTDSARGKAVETCDDFGVPSETAEIVRPTVTTQAKPLVAPGDTMFDTAVVEGEMPDAPASVGFTGYLKPEAGAVKVDENWDPILDESGEPVLWTQEEIDALGEEACEVQPVVKTDRVEVSGAGSYESPEVEAKTEGTVYWVEDLVIEDTASGEQVEVHRGKCGLPNETTFIDHPNVTTKATQEAVAGDAIKDTAIVTGPLAEREGVEYEVTFEAFQQPADEEEAVCEVENLVFETDVPTPVTGEGEFDSEEFVTSEKNIGQVNWVETLRIIENGESEVVHRGECGAEFETTTVKAKPAVAAAATASDSTGMIAGGFAALLAAAAAAGAGLFMVKRKRRTAAEVTETTPTDSE